MKPYRTDEYVHKLFYETARFSAFNQQWVVKARINNSQRDPHQSNERAITYQLILKTKTSTPMSIHFFALKGPFSDMKVSTQIYKHEFTETVGKAISLYHIELATKISSLSAVHREWLLCAALARWQRFRIEWVQQNAGKQGHQLPVSYGPDPSGVPS